MSTVITPLEPEGALWSWFGLERFSHHVPIPRFAPPSRQLAKDCATSDQKKRAGDIVKELAAALDQFHAHDRGRVEREIERTQSEIAKYDLLKQRDAMNPHEHQEAAAKIEALRGEAAALGAKVCDAMADACKKTLCGIAIQIEKELRAGNFPLSEETYAGAGSYAKTWRLHSYPSFNEEQLRMCLCRHVATRLRDRRFVSGGTANEFGICRWIATDDEMDCPLSI